jgi:hypothetical protein
MMKLTIYSLTWDARNACSRIGTELFTSKDERDAKLVEWVSSRGIEIENVDQLYSDEVLNALGARDIEYVLDEHTIEIDLTKYVAGARP